MVAVLSAWLAVSSLFFWGAPQHPGAHGVVALVAAGAPAWILVVPLPAVVALLCLLWPQPGKFAAALCCIMAAVVLILGAGAAIQYDQGHRAQLDLAVGSAYPAIILLVSCALPLAMNDLVAPDRPLAALARYWSVRQWQFFELYQWGRAHDWRVRTISGRAVGIALCGAPDPHDPAVEVSARSLCAHASRPPRITLRLAWPEERRQELPWFHLGTTPPRVPLPPGAVVVRWRRGLGHPLWCAVGPGPDGQVASEQRLEDLHRLVQGAGYRLWGCGVICRTPTGLIYLWRPRSRFPIYPDTTTIVWLEAVARQLAKHEATDPGNASV